MPQTNIPEQHPLTRFNPSILPTLDALRRQGKTYHSIAYATGVSLMTAYRAINRLGTYKGLP